MKILASYNFDSEIIDEIGDDFDLIYRKKNRNSCFAFAYQKNEDEVVALRDHLGIVPLYYRFEGDNVRFDTSLSRLVKEGDELLENGARSFIACKTPVFHPLIKGINIVPPAAVVKINIKKRTSELIHQFVFVRQPVLKINLEDLLISFDKLIFQAIERVLKFETVGLYLSGGMDSGLVGVYLRKAGAKVNAYTTAPWGMEGSEVKFARLNAEAINPIRHTIMPLNTSRYIEYLQQIPETFGTINGLNTAIGVVGLWHDTTIKNEKQIFGAQNADTMLCSMPHQYYVYFLSWLPVFLKQQLHQSFRHKDTLSDYVDYCTHGISSRAPDFFGPYASKKTDKLSLLTLAGMYIGHTPPDGSVLAAPAINSNISYANPYYDIDLIEWSMRLPIRFRLGFSKESKIKISLNKTVLRKLAEKYLSKEVIYRKKGFVVPMQRDETTKKLTESLPVYFGGLKLEKTDERLAAYILKIFCEQRGIKY